KIGPTQKGLWPAIEPRILELILAHRSTIVFVNSRGLAERLAQSLNELHLTLLDAAGETHDGSTLVRSHHGSVAHAQRREIEELLKGGALRAIVATSSLELGIDMGAVDLVIQVESPDSSARGLQRVGRAGHHVGGISRGKIFPKHRGDLLEAAVVSQMMLEGQIESITIPKNPLDVLAQHLVAMVAVEPWSISAAKTLVKGAYPFTDLTEDVWLATLDMVSGHFPGNDLAELRPRINWNRTTDMLEARKGSRLIATVNGGTIPDRGLYGVFLAGESDGKKAVRVGELDEEMVHEARVGETFMLGASTWRITEITRDRVMVTPAPGEPGKMPFWKGDGPGRPIETGRRLGAFTRQLAELVDDEDAADRMLATHTPLDLKARKNLITHIREQRAATGVVPSDRTIIVERFKDELGDLRVCILTPFGARVHAPWALAIEESLGQKTGQEVQAIYTDDGISLRFAAPDPIPPPDGGPSKYNYEYYAAQAERHRQAKDEVKPPGLDELFVDPEDLEDRIIERLSTSAMFSGVFRENAARALLLPRRSPEGRAPLWQQRLRSQSLLGAVRRFPNFPILLETYRTCVKDIFDLPALTGLMRQVISREVRVVEVDTREASPFSRGLAFAFVASYMYEVDNPVAERRAQALTLDKNLLRELLGHDELRALFSPEVIAGLERELQALVDPYRAAHADQLHDLLRRLGALTRDEIALRVEDGVDGKALVAELLEKRRAVVMRVAGREHVVAIEDCAMYRDAL
ncbi:MAG TPA: helicase-related protein, partial [Myxococcota bacterium]|nr:helicase-related protein [Myxococcota bacterium]